MKRDSWLVTFKSVKIVKLKNVRRQLEGLGFSTSTMWSPGVELRLFDLTASLFCPMSHLPGPHVSFEQQEWSP